MICQNCLKNQSNYHFTKIINGNKSEYHLCESCAREKGDIIQGPGNSYSIHNLLSGMLNIEFGVGAGGSKEKATDNRCATCGMSFREFSKKGRFGCADCYRAFADQLEPLIRRMQQNNLLHAGKTPSGQPAEATAKLDFAQQLAALEEELHAEIRNERYERAAVIRDRISALRRQQEGLQATDIAEGIGSKFYNPNVTPKKWVNFDAGDEEV